MNRRTSNVAVFGDRRRSHLPCNRGGGRERAHNTAAFVFSALATFCLVGCYHTQKPLHYIGDAALEHYKDVATKVDYPVLEQESNSLALATSAPRRIRDRSKDEIWDMPLAEAIQVALQNSAIIRERDQFLSPRNPLYANPEAVTSLYDPAIQESEVRFGNRGVEAALADFDAQFAASMLWGRNEQVQNNLFNSGGLPPGETLKDETGVFQSRLQKQFADSGSFAITHNWNYSLNNVPTRLFGSVYDGTLRAEYRRPLWSRSGAEFTRVVGPNSSIGAGVNQGVVIARINNDITIADFEINMQTLLRDVEGAYWDLSLAYRAWHSETVALQSALSTWREVKAQLDEGFTGGSAADEAQARDNYYESLSRVETAQADIYSSEGQLRRLIGLPVNDGRIIRPSDEPTVAEFIPDWQMSLFESISRRTELRRQKWQIKSLEHQLNAARSLTKPEFDFVSGYQVNAFGDTLFDDNDDDPVTPHGLNSAYGTLTQGDQTGWNLGFEFRMPLGFRSGHALVRNIELRLMKAREQLAAQEMEVSHELSQAFQSLDRWYKTAETNFNRRRAAEERVQAFEVQYELGGTTLDLLLRAQISLANAEVAYFRSLAEYNKAITEIHYRKGSLLEHNNVHLAEGIWDGEAYNEALRRAWARSHAIDNPLLHTEPAEFVSEVPPPTPMVRMAPEQVGSYTLPGTQMLPIGDPYQLTPPGAPPAESSPVSPPAPPERKPAPKRILEPMAGEPTLERTVSPSVRPETRQKAVVTAPESMPSIEVSDDPAIWRRGDSTSKAAGSEPWRQRSENTIATTPPALLEIEPLDVPSNVERRGAERKLIDPPALERSVDNSPVWNPNDGPQIKARPTVPATPAPGLSRPKEPLKSVADNWAPRDAQKKKLIAPKKELITPQIEQGWAPSGASSRVDAADRETDLSIRPNSATGDSNVDWLPDLPTRWRGTVSPTAAESPSLK